MVCLGQSSGSGLLDGNTGLSHLVRKMRKARYGLGGGRMWVVIVLIPDHCLSFYLAHNKAGPYVQCKNTHAGW